MKVRQLIKDLTLFEMENDVIAVEGQLPDGTKVPTLLVQDELNQRRGVIPLPPVEHHHQGAPKTPLGIRPKPAVVQATFAKEQPDEG